MKKAIIIMLSLFLCLGLASCDNDTPPSTGTLTNEEISEMYESEDFASYIGRDVKDLPILVNGTTIIEDMTDTYSGTISDYDITGSGFLDFGLNTGVDFSLEERQYVLVSGTITDAITYDREISPTVPFILVDSIELNPDYIVYPAEDTVELNCELEKKDFKVTLQQVEQSKNSTRIHCSLENKSDKDTWILVYSPKIDQNKKTFALKDNYFATDTLETEVASKETNEGFLSFERIDDIHGAFSLKFDVSNSEDGAKLASFEFTIQDGVVTVKEETKPSSEPEIAPASTSFGEGVYKVGTDISAGEYKLTATNSYEGYFCVYTSPPGTDEKIASNGNFNNTGYVTVKDGEYLELSRCRAEKVE